MSSAHRPTWDPARGQNNAAHLSRVAHASQLPAHTTLKVRQAAQGGVLPGAVGPGAARARRDLRKELERAEREARNKKRAAQGLPLEPEPADEPDAQPQGTEAATDAKSAGAEDEQVAKRKRQKLIEAAIRLDASDDEDEGSDSDDGARVKVDKGKGKARDEDDVAAANGGGAAAGSDSSDSDSDSDDEDDEDDTAALLRELEKIKRERAEEKARQEREAAELAQSEREDEIALGNPLLNLENQIRAQNAANEVSSAGAGAAPSFGVKRRWDDDVIFKNQAAGVDKQDRSSFVNDMIRTEFHKKFMYRYLK